MSTETSNLSYVAIVNVHCDKKFIALTVHRRYYFVVYAYYFIFYKVNRELQWPVSKFPSNAIQTKLWLYNCLLFSAELDIICRRLIDGINEGVAHLEPHVDRSPMWVSSWVQINWYNIYLTTFRKLNGICVVTGDILLRMRTYEVIYKKIMLAY